MSATKGPIPWPNYPERQLVLDGNIVGEVDKRIAEICVLYEIDQQDPSWERQLLAALLNRHVPCFGMRREKGKSVDNAFLIENVEGLKDFHEKNTGHRPSTEAVAHEIAQAPADDNEFHGMTPTRIMRIHSGRAKELNALHEDLERDTRRAAEICEGQAALRQAPDSFAALLLAVIKARGE